MTPLERLAELGSKPELLVAGLMTGTSVDGLDIAICRIRTTLDAMPELVLGRTVDLPPDLRHRLITAKDDGVPALARADLALGRFQAEALKAVLEEAVPQEAGWRPLDLVGSHGQTAYHEHRVTTLQIGEPACIAQALDCAVVSDFRRADVAAGGSGAPLVPIFDQLFLRDPQATVMALNIGGIANFTVLPADGGPPIAMDCGPGNMIVDGLVRRMTNGQQDYDKDGAMAANRRIDHDLVAELAGRPELAAPPPRSLGREEFGDHFVDMLIERKSPASDADWADLIATATAFTAEALARTYMAHVAEVAPVERILVSGGGVHNPTLLRAIELRLPDVEVASTASIGLDPDFKEAIAFATFAVLTLFAPPIDTTRITGANYPVRLGKLSLP